MKAFLGVLVLFMSTLFALQNAAYSQSTITFILQSKVGTEDLRDVEFTVQRNENVFFSKTDRRGMLQFFITKSDRFITIKVAKEGFVTKEIDFFAEDYVKDQRLPTQKVNVYFKRGSQKELQRERLQYNGNSYVLLPFKDGDGGKELMTMDKISEDKPEVEKPKEEEQVADDPVEETKLDESSTAEEPAPREKIEIKSKEKTSEPAVEEPETEELQPEIEEVYDAPINAEDDFISVQVGSFSKSVNTAYFKNVPEFSIREENGLKRCFSGDFNTISEAKIRKNELNSIGFSDAFVVRYQNSERVSVVVPETSESVENDLTSDFTEDISETLITVQVGSFSGTINTEYFKNVSEFRIVEEKGLKKCISGSFKTVSEAELRRQEVVNLGFTDAFVVRFKN